MAEYYSCAVIYRSIRPPKVPASERIEFLVIDYQSINPKTKEVGGIQVKFPGGGMKYPHEYPGMTMVREVFEETSLCIYNWKKEWSIEVSPTHTQYGFLVSAEEDCRGSIQEYGVDDDDGDLLSPPYWVKASILGRGIFPSHREHYLAACRELDIEPIPDPYRSP